MLAARHFRQNRSVWIGVSEMLSDLFNFMKSNESSPVKPVAATYRLRGLFGPRGLGFEEARISPEQP